jgi:cobalt-zinc-cadmium efflux system membrane fusion protein
MNRRTLLLTGTLLCAALSAACTGGGADAAPLAAPAAPAAPADTALLGAEAVRIAGLRVEPVRAAAWRDEWSGPGRLALDPSVTQPLGAIVEGRVVRVLALPGDTVRAGEVLVTLHSHEMLDALGARATARAGLVRAENDARLAASAAERAERLYQGRAASLAELERARAARVDAEALCLAAAAEERRATALVAHLLGEGPVPAGVEPHEVLVRSPMEGVVVDRAAQPGEVVVVGAPLLTVSRLSQLQLVLHLPDGALAAVAPGATVHFTVRAEPGRDWTAEVTRVAPAVDAATRTVEVLARVSDPGGALRPEMFASARVEGPGGSPVLVVPAAAVQAMDGDTVLVVAEPRGEGLRIRAVPVRIGRRTSSRAEVLGGVVEGTPVVVAGAAVARAEILRRREAGAEAR